MIINSKDILNKAKQGKYAVPQFNINNLEWTRYILEACEEEKVPVILGVSEGAIKYIGGYNVVVNLVKSLVRDLNITIPVVIHLDHGSTAESCLKAIDAGFTSVMIDASKHSLEENIAITKQVVDYAHPKNVTVEAEIGHIGGSEDNINASIAYANTDDCIKLVNSTNIDSLAPALGSVHGIYKGEPNLDFTRMEEIKNKTDLPLVLHGGTGIPDNQIKQAISCGTTKLNINTELQLAWTNEVRKFLNNDQEVYDPRKVIKSGEQAIKQAVKTKINLLNTKLYN